MSDTRCRDCGGTHDTPAIEAWCVYVKVLRDEVVTYAATLDRPPKPAAVLDLWSHARTFSDDGHQSARWVRKVLDLGWRPTVGSAS